MKHMKERYEELELDAVKEQIIRHCSFSLGKQKIRQLSPRFEELWVRRELTRTQEALTLVYRYGNLPFQGVHDIGNAIEDARRNRTLSCLELRQSADSIRAVEHVVSYFKASEVETPRLKELIASFDQPMPVANAIETCISSSCEVMDQASGELKSIRKSIRMCEGEISKEAQRFIASHSTQLMDTITTMRNDRICVLVKISEKNSVDGFIHGESASGQTAYIEPKSLLILNNRLASLKSREQEEIARILFALSQKVKTVAHALEGNLETFALLDVIFSKALWAKEKNGCIAQLDNQHHHLYLKQAKHPLIDEQYVVANTYEIKEPYRSLLITGSNTGGKTVTLKTIGLFVVMTMCGMAVSAQEAIIPVFNGVYVNIGDDQSIAESLSTFSSHISQLAAICHKADANSLVLLDELGNGTDPKEGEPLAVAILEELSRRRATIIATTHYSALKSYAAGKEDMLVSSVEFDMEALRPTYRYIEGISGQSNAFAIAERYGLSKRIIADAKRRKDEQASANDIAMEKLEQLTMEVEEKKQKMEQRLQDVRLLQETLATQKSKFEKEKEQLLEQVKADAKKKLDEVQEEAELLLEELKQMKANAKPHEITELKSAMRKLQIDDEELVEESDEVFAVGDYVKLKKLNYYGEIISMNKDKVCVLANGMKMNTTTKDITHEKRKIVKKKTKGYTKSSIASFSMECNVIGMRVAEAIPIIDKYLDNALLAKVYQVRIIHGMGTGKLRKGVHDYLKHNPQVESYTMGGQGEGGLGATVVKLKQKGK